MSTPTPPEDGAPTGPPPGDSDPFGTAPQPPPPQAGPWASDNLPPHPLAGMAAQMEQMERPEPIRVAVNLMYIGAGLAVLGIVVALLLIGDLRDQIRDDNPTFTQSQVDTGVNVGIAFIVVIGLIGVGLWLWMAHENGAGKMWARTVATVLGVVNVLLTLIRIGANTMGANIFGLVSIVLAIAILVLLYRPDATAYYKARSA
ncbi:MAG TPA: hypothetical protein VH479_17260 [Acidimicrobiales bacterium]|jgi:hypothetical protein